MAYEGELVKLGNGRWARFQHVAVDGALSSWDGAILVAVELDEQHQRMLNEAEGSLSSMYFQHDAPLQLRMEPDAQGALNVRLQESVVH